MIMTGNLVASGKELEYEFSTCLKKALERKSVFGEDTHIYLTGVLMKYVCLDSDKLTSSLNLAGNDAFLMQVNDGSDEDMRGKHSRYKNIGETLLLSVGYWPESLSAVEIDHGDKKVAIRARPPLDYYAGIGKQAYESAAATAYHSRLEGHVTDIMEQMSKGFREYAGVVFEVRQEMGGNAVSDIGVLFSLAQFFGEDYPLTYYVLGGKTKGADRNKNDILDDPLIQEYIMNLTDEEKRRIFLIGHSEEEEE